MLCPTCHMTNLAELQLQEGLLAHCCGTCHGTWLGSADYWRWREHQQADLPEQPAAEPEPCAAERSAPLLCPYCGHLLLPYRIGHGIAFRLDHCGNCNGIWFDEHEWSVLRARKLHDNLHQMFGPHWQRQVRAEEHRSAMAAIYTQRFGAADYAELQRIKLWIDQHPQRDTLLAYLNNPEPYRLRP